MLIVRVICTTDIRRILEDKGVKEIEIRSHSEAGNKSDFSGIVVLNAGFTGSLGGLQNLKPIARMSRGETILSKVMMKMRMKMILKRLKMDCSVRMMQLALIC